MWNDTAFECFVQDSALKRKASSRNGSLPPRDVPLKFVAVRVQAMSGKEADGGVLGDDDDNVDDEGMGGGDGLGKEQGDDKDYFNLPNLSGARHFKGITKNKKTGEVEVTIRLSSR